MNRASVIPGLTAAGCLLATSVAFAQDGCTPEWSSVGGGADWFAGVAALAIFDEKQARLPTLFAGGGYFTFGGIDAPFITRWDGWKPSVVGGGLTTDAFGPLCLTPVDEMMGTLPRGLYAGGRIKGADGQPVSDLARWDGQAWHDVGGGVRSYKPNIYDYVYSTCVFDEDGQGPAPASLFVGGWFEYAGEVPVRSFARWDGQAWSAIPGDLNTGYPDFRPDVRCLAVFDDGRGPALYVGGYFSDVGGKVAANIARWDGTSWEPLDVGPNAIVHTMTAYDEDGPGPKKPTLFVGGSFTWAGGGDGQEILHIARWDGQNWSPVGGWISDGSVFASAVWKGPDDDRENLYIGGTFNLLPDHTPIKGIARWDGKTWREVDYGVGGFGEGTQVDAIHPFDEDGDGPNPGGLYVGGMFHYAGTKGVETNHIARWGCPLGPRCDADLDRSGALDLFDFLAFLNLFNAEDPTADCTADGAFDLFDFLCFANAFNQGC